MLWVVWGAKEQQLNESLEQQAELSAVVFDRWLDAQRQPLVTLASYPAEHFREAAALEADLRPATVRRPHWIDVRVIDAGGRFLAAHPSDAGSLPAGLAERLLAEAQSGEAAIETDRTPERGRGRVAGRAWPSERR